LIGLLLPVLALFGRLEERPTSPASAPSRPAAAVVLAAVVVYVPVVDAALNGLTLGLLGGGAACFALAVLLLVTWRAIGARDVRGTAPATIASPSGAAVLAEPVAAEVR
jgi:hypothetical protein